jgi:hypothetical protein
MPQNAGAIGPHSRPHRLAKPDGRTREARYMRGVRDGLVRHVGSPSAVEAQLIERAAMLSLHVALFDRRAIANGGLSARDAREYLALHNSLVRTLARLGLKGAAQRPPSLAERLRAVTAAPR